MMEMLEYVRFIVLSLVAFAIVWLPFAAVVWGISKVNDWVSYIPYKRFVNKVLLRWLQEERERLSEYQYTAERIEEKIDVFKETISKRKNKFDDLFNGDSFRYPDAVTEEFDKYKKTAIAKTMSVVTVSLIIVIAFSFLSYMSYIFETETKTTSSTHNLYAMEDNMSFVLRGRYMRTDGSEEITYGYTVKKDGFFKSYIAKAQNSRIGYVKAGETPTVVIERTSDIKVDKWYTPIQRFLNVYDSTPITERLYTPQLTFYVPEGAVKETYNSDLK